MAAKQVIRGQIHNKHKPGASLYVHFLNQTPRVYKKQAEMTWIDNRIPPHSIFFIKLGRQQIARGQRLPKLLHGLGLLRRSASPLLHPGLTSPLQLFLLRTNPPAQMLQE
jgi:hypothetical protein